MLFRSSHHGSHGCHGSRPDPCPWLSIRGCHRRAAFGAKHPRRFRHRGRRAGNPIFSEAGREGTLIRFVFLGVTSWLPLLEGDWTAFAHSSRVVVVQFLRSKPPRITRMSRITARSVSMVVHPWLSPLRLRRREAPSKVPPDRKSTRLNSSHVSESRMPSSA